MAFWKKLQTLIAPRRTEQVSDNVAASNTNAFASLPPNVLEIFLPGYGPVTRLLSDLFGFDVTYLGSLGLILVGGWWALQFSVKFLAGMFAKHFTARIRIEHWDGELYDIITEWATEQEFMKKCVDLTARTRFVWEDNEDEDISNFQTAPDEYLNIREWNFKRPLSFQLSPGTHRFRHDGKLFFLNQQSETRMSRFNYPVERQMITLSCLGRSTISLKQLIDHCLVWYMRKKAHKTLVFRPTKPQPNERTRWTKVANRHSRPIETVVLDDDQKKKVLDDISEYLHPSTMRWYHKRGIPFRRGYLFTGAPGTGKTSFSFSIAGLFGLKIYCISLSEPSLTEDDLAILFNELPRRCVVLLEDIDTAGLEQRDESTPNDSKLSTNSVTSSSFSELSDGHEEPAKGNNKKRPEKKRRRSRSHSHWNKKNRGISLSGLLNAIDGVASHEGRVLVITTNRPEDLDAALIRPGRVDMQVAFPLATREQIEQLFVRMYTPDADEQTRRAQVSTLDQQADKPEVPGVLVDTEPLRAMEQSAKRFAEALPVDALSPAEVQGYLLTHKGRPERAVDEVELWVSSIQEGRKAKSSIS